MEDSRPILVVVNPMAGTFSESRLAELKRLLREYGVAASFHMTNDAGDATDWRRDARHGSRAVLAMGGDGTVHEVVNVLAGSSTPLGIIPAGTGNVLARGLMIPRNSLRKALEISLGKKKRRIDLGIVNGTYFVIAAGVGFDAFVASKVNSDLKKRWGTPAYAFVAVKEALRFKASPITVETEFGEFEGLSAVIGNSRIYGGPLAMVPSAEMDDGVLDMVIFKHMNASSALRYAAGATLRRMTRFSDVTYLKIREARIRSREPVPVHADAEPCGTTPVNISVCRRCLEVLAP
jgi:diacylglycerol kinase (ATP)